MSSSSLRAQWLGPQPYLAMLRHQRSRREAILEGRASDVLWLLEHPPVVTTGRRAVSGLEIDALERRGIPVVNTERGGLATFHGPGQLVGYLICDVRRHRQTVKGSVYAIEGGLIAWLGGHGVDARRRCGTPGVWVGDSKIGAVGLHFRKNVSMHGFSLNLTVDLAPFGLFVPCGLAKAGVTSLFHLTGARVDPVQAEESVGEQILSHFMGRSG